MITKEQFQEIKQYVLNRLSSEQEFHLSLFYIAEKFGIQKPFYQELIKLNEEDGISFLTKAETRDANGDPSEPLLFYRKSE